MVVMAVHVVAVGTMIGTPAPPGHKLDALVFLPLKIFFLDDLIIKLEAPPGRRESEGAPFRIVLLSPGLRDGDGLAGADDRDKPAVLPLLLIPLLLRVGGAA